MILDSGLLFLGHPVYKWTLYLYVRDAVPYYRRWESCVSQSVVAFGADECRIENDLSTRAGGMFLGDVVGRRPRRTRLIVWIWNVAFAQAVTSRMHTLHC